MIPIIPILTLVLVIVFAVAVFFPMRDMEALADHRSYGFYKNGSKHTTPRRQKHCSLCNER